MPHQCSQCGQRQPIVLRTSDHPEADGRDPRDGEEYFTIFLPLEGDDVLQLELGMAQYHALRRAMTQNTIDLHFENAVEQVRLRQLSTARR